MTTPIIDLPYFPRPDLTDQVEKVVSSGLSGAITLFAKRRKGKTTWVRNELLPWAESQRWETVYIDLWSDREHPEEALIAGLTAAARRSLLSKLKSVKVSGKVHGIEIGAEMDGPAAASEAARQETRAKRLTESFDALMRKKRSVFVAIDEFQTLAGKGRENFVAAFRALLQKYAKTLFVIYTGSSQEMLQAMFRSQRAPLLDSAYAMELPNLGAAFVRDRTVFCNARSKVRIKQADLADVFKDVDYSPEALNQIVLRVIVRGDGNLIEALRDWRQAVSAALKPAVWDQLERIPRVLLLRMAKNNQTTGFTNAQTRAELGHVSPTAVQAALRLLERHELIHPTGLRGRYEISDPAVREFVKAQVTA